MKRTKDSRGDSKIGLDRVYALLEAYRSGRLRGEKMPEEENPGLDRGKSGKLYLFYTSHGAQLSEKLLYLMGMRQQSLA